MLLKPEGFSDAAGSKAERAVAGNRQETRNTELSDSFLVTIGAQEGTA
jgi:hypothetical protein